MPTSHDSTHPEYRRLVEQETLIADAQELVCELLERVNMSRQELASRLGKTKGYVSQLLSGERNMTLRTLADLAFAMDYRIELTAVGIDQPRNYQDAGPALTWSADHPNDPGDAYDAAFRPALNSIQRQAVPIHGSHRNFLYHAHGRQHAGRSSRDYTPIAK